MYLKTTSPQFLEYGRVTDLPSKYDSQRISLEDKSLQFLSIYNCKVRIEVLEGIAILVIQKAPGKFEQFVIHRAPIIDAKVPFVVIPLTQSVLIETSFQTKSEVIREIVEVPGKKQYEPIRSSFDITDIYSYYYNVKGKGYSFAGESHYYWELTYVDTGEVVITVDDVEYNVSSQELMVFFPGQFHKQHIEGNNSSSYVTVMFDMNVEWHDIKHLKNRVIECNNELYELINKFIEETTILENSNRAYSRALQFFVPGIPQVYYVGLLAGTNNAEKMKETGDGREINRENFSIEEVEESLNKNVVKRLLELIRFRNKYPAFDGAFTIIESDQESINLRWENNQSIFTLFVSLKSGKAKIDYINSKNEQVEYIL